MSCKVLVVEDDLLHAFRIMSRVEAAGHTVIGPAPDSALALALANRHRPAIALVGHRLRDGDRGVDLARALRERGIPSVSVGMILGHVAGGKLETATVARLPAGI